MSSISVHTMLPWLSRTVMRVSAVSLQAEKILMCWDIIYSVVELNARISQSVFIHIYLQHPSMSSVSMTMFARHGFPLHVKSDNGSQLIS